MKQEAIFKKFREKKALFAIGNRQGQAVVEYILMLVIIVSLVLGLRGVFSSMNNYMSNILGEYIACLMEFGELPSLGIDVADLKKHETGAKQCHVPSFSASTAFSGGGGTGGTGPGGTGPGGTGGTGGTGTGGTGGTKNGSNSNNGNNGANNGAGKNGNGSDGNNSNSGSDSSGGNGSSANRGRRGGSGSSPYSRGQITRYGGASTADGLDAAEGNKVKSLADGSGKDSSGGGDGYGGGRNSRRGGYDSSKYKAITGNMAAEVEEKAKGPARKPGSTTLVAKDEGYRLTALKRTVNPPEFKEKVEEQKNEEFSFGNFFKWLVIAGIVIACFILFGGQVMNYSNSDS